MWLTEGLGNEIDEKAVAEMQAKLPKNGGGWPKPQHEMDGAIAGY